VPAFHFTNAQRRDLEISQAAIRGIEADVTAYRLRPWADSIETLRSQRATPPRVLAGKQREILGRIATNAKALRRDLASAPRQVTDTLTVALRHGSPNHPGVHDVVWELEILEDKATRVSAWIQYDRKAGRRARLPAVFDAAVAERLLMAGCLDRRRLATVLQIVLEAEDLKALSEPGGALDRRLDAAIQEAHAAVARARHRRATG
jgi:hypothetical protein